MSLQLTSSELEKVYENISETLDQNSILEEIKVSAGAVPSIAIVLFSPLSPYEQIKITDRISGSFIRRSKRKEHVELGKIRIGNEVRGVEIVRSFDDCGKCMKSIGCDKYEAGSIMFSNTMCTGYTNRDIAYKESLGLFSGNCDFRFHRHLPSKPLPEVISCFYANDIIPYSVGGWRDFMAFVDDLLHGRKPRPVDFTVQDFILEGAALDPKLLKIYFAINCAKLIIDAYSLLRD